MELEGGKEKKEVYSGKLTVHLFNFQTRWQQGGEVSEVPGIPPQSTWRSSAQPLPTLLLSVTQQAPASYKGSTRFL